MYSSLWGAQCLVLIVVIYFTLKGLNKVNKTIQCKHVCIDCMYACAFAHARACVRLRACAPACARVRMRVYLCVCTCACAPVRVHLCVCVCVYAFLIFSPLSFPVRMLDF